MAVLNKFYQVTNFMLLEYKTDQYSIMEGVELTATEIPDGYMYLGPDNKQYYIDTDTYKNRPFIADNGDTVYPGTGSDRPIVGTVNPTERQSQQFIGKKLYADPLPDDSGILQPVEIGNIILSQDRTEIRKCAALRDTIRIYFSMGYMLNTLSGFQIKVHAPVKHAQLDPKQSAKYAAYDPMYRPADFVRTNGDITVLDFCLIKSQLFGMYKWLTTPLYYNSKFYDRYIEIKFPAPYDLALHKAARAVDYLYTDVFTDVKTNKEEYLIYRGFIDEYSPATIEFSTITDESCTFITNDDVVGTGTVNECAATYLADSPTKFPITHHTNSNYFNVELYEDDETGTIVYQPVYGDPNVTEKMGPIDIQRMLQIDTNTIPMYDFADLDGLNDNIDDFLELYGEDAFRWCIINELSVSYYYDYIVQPDSTTPRTIEPLTEYYTNTIDYTGKTKEHGEFYKSKFLPYIKQRPNMVCTSISFRYTAHLYNRLNLREITRTASMTVNNPQKYAKHVINTASINKVNVINKIIKTTPSSVKLGSGNNTVSGVLPAPIFHSTTNIVVKTPDSATYSEQGYGVLKLYKTSTYYKIQVYTTESLTSSRVPLDMADGTSYKIKFNLQTSGQYLTLRPMTDSDGTQLQLGVLMFYITEQDAHKVLDFNGDHFFSICTDTGAANKDSTLYQGLVQWV